MSVLGAIVAICAGLVSIASGITTLWKKATESKAKKELAKTTAALATSKQHHAKTTIALAHCQRRQQWQGVIIFAAVIVVLILASRSPMLRGA